jgi:hypothetical protein
VAEPDAARPRLDQPCLLGLGERREPRAEQRLHELGRHRRGHDRQPLERVAALAADLPQAPEHGVLDAGRNLVGRRGERLGDEERVARRQRVDGVGVASRAVGKRADGLARKR